MGLCSFEEIPDINGEVDSSHKLIRVIISKLRDIIMTD